MQEPCVADHKRAVNAHETLLERFDSQATLADQLDSYFHIFDAYCEVGRAADWLEQTEHLVEQIGDEITLMHRALYTRERGKALREWGRHREAAHTSEAFINWLQNTETVDPEKQALLIGAQGDYLHLAPTYYQLGEHQKVKALLAQAEANLEGYLVERDTVLANITEKVRQRANGWSGFIETQEVILRKAVWQISVAGLIGSISERSTSPRRASLWAAQR